MPQEECGPGMNEMVQYAADGDEAGPAVSVEGTLSVVSIAKTYGKLHRTHLDTMAGLVAKLFAKLGRIPPSDPKDLADIIMALTTGLSLQGTSVQGPLRKGFVTEAILLVLGLDSIEGNR